MSACGLDLPDISYVSWGKCLHFSEPQLPFLLVTSMVGSTDSAKITCVQIKTDLSLLGEQEV